MKQIVKYSNCIAFILALCAIINSGCRCAATKQDPLAGWQKVYNHDPDAAIVKDYQDYIHKLVPQERNYVGPIFYYEDGQGQHAVTFEVDKYGKDVWNHYLFYDKEDKRTKVIKYYRGQYWNP